VTSESSLRKERGDTYASPSGVGPARNVVSFSAICAHKLAYPTRDVSFIRYQKIALRDVRRPRHPLLRRSQRLRSAAGGARRRRAGAAAAGRDRARYDAGRDELWAIGTVGAEQFGPFFEKYAFKLELEYGGLDRARKPVDNTPSCAS
jgi:hypothetical protein